MARARLEAEIGGGTARFDIDYEEVEVVGPEQVAQDPGGTAVAKLNKSLDDALASARPAAEAVIKSFERSSPTRFRSTSGSGLTQRQVRYSQRRGLALTSRSA